MAICPKCNGEMLQTEIVCSQCGFDFPPGSQRRMPPGGFAYSPLADVALIVSMCAAFVGAFVTGFAAIVSIAQGQFANGLFFYPLAMFLQLGMLVVFIRVQQ